jgi:homoserine kinase type II
MAALTVLDEPAAARILSAYGLALEGLTALPEKGTVNSNFRVRAGGRDYFLRVNEGKSVDDVIAEATIVAAVRAAGLATPEIIPTRAGAPYARHGERPVTLFPWLPGREATGAAEAPLVGAALATLHLAAARLDHALPHNHYTLESLLQRLNRFAGDPRFSDVVALLAEELERARRDADGELPSGLIHQDLFPDNLLVDETGALVAVLDFEQATEGRFVYDLAVSINAFCWDGERITGAMDALLGAYRRLRPLSDREEAALWSQARLAAARFTITRVTDVWLPTGVDPDLKRRKDYRDYARRLHFWRDSG